MPPEVGALSAKKRKRVKNWLK